MPEFTAQHGLALMALLVSFDPRHNGDEATIRGKAETWSKLLNHAGADPAWVRSFVERAYSDPRPYQLQVGDIIRAWGNAQRVEESRKPQTLLFGSSVPEGFTDLVAASKERWMLARQAASGSELWRQQRAETQRVDAAVVVPWPIVAVRDERERACGVKLCVCTHTACRDGWDDLPGEGGRVQRCMICREALEMQSELAPSRGRRGRR